MIIQRIETKRLVLKPANNKEDLSRYLADLSSEEFFYQFGHEYDEQLLEGYNFTVNGVICYSIFLPDTNAMIGYIGIKPSNEDERSTGELEYYIFRKYRGHGYCQEAAKAMIEAFRQGEITGKKGKSVSAWVVSGNIKSAHVLDKLGFIKTDISIHIYTSCESDSGEAMYHSIGMTSYELTFDPEVFEDTDALQLAA